MNQEPPSQSSKTLPGVDNLSPIGVDVNTNVPAPTTFRQFVESQGHKWPFKATDPAYPQMVAAWEAAQNGGEVPKAEPKSKVAALRRKAAAKTTGKAAAKGPQNLVTRITTPDAQGNAGIKFGQDYDTKTLREFPDLKRVSNQKTGMSPDEWAANLNAEGYVNPTGEEWTGDSLIETLKTGQGRNIFPPEKQDAMMDRQIRSEENAWIERQLADLEAEAVDAGTTGREVRQDIETRILEEAKAEGDLTSEDAAAAELNDFFDSVSKDNKPTPKGEFANTDLPGMSAAETFDLSNPETEIGTLQPQDKGPQTATLIAPSHHASRLIVGSSLPSSC